MESGIEKKILMRNQFWDKGKACKQTEELGKGPADATWEIAYPACEQTGLLNCRLAVNQLNVCNG